MTLDALIHWNSEFSCLIPFNSGSSPLSKYVESDGEPLLSHFSYAQRLAAAGGKDDKYDPDDPEMILFSLTTPP